MANPEHLRILRQGVVAWNAWRDQHRDIHPILHRADLRRADLREANLRGVSLFKADLREADLREATLTYASLFKADLRRAILYYTSLFKTDLRQAQLDGASLFEADLRGARLWDASLRAADLRGADLEAVVLRMADLRVADLSGANLDGADLYGANLDRADLSGANLSRGRLEETIFGDTNLTAVQGLETCHYSGPSILDHRTLAQSGPLPLAFLRGCGLPDALIAYLPSLLNEPFEFYSCFISYARKDQAFAERLYADLQNKGVRCWFAPEDMKIGDRLRPRIDETIRLYDKLLLVLSKTSVTSQWVEQEVETALARERQHGTTILFPVRIDNTVMTMETGWPALIRNTRHIGDFRRWKTHDVYQKAFDRLLRDLKAAERQPESSRPGG